MPRQEMVFESISQSYHFQQPFFGFLVALHPVEQYCDNIMIDSSRKQTAIYARANNQLREIETACRQVTLLARKLNTFSAELAVSEVNCRKVEMLKGDIRDKLREYASNIDALYQLLDRKIQIMLAGIKQMQARTSLYLYCKKCHSTTTNASVSHMDDEFSQTLNPRIMRLQSKISQYQTNQIKLRERIVELQAKNATLLEQYRHSSPSNNKFCQIKSFSAQENPENDTLYYSLNKKMVSPQTTLQFSSSKRKFNLIHSGSEQTSYEQQFAYESKPRFHKLGSISSRKSTTSLRGSSREDEEKIDRSRRLDLLLNKLRDSQQESTEGIHQAETRRIDELFAHSPVRRHHI